VVYVEIMASLIPEIRSSRPLVLNVVVFSTASVQTVEYLRSIKQNCRSRNIMITKRNLLRGLFAAPAIVAVQNIMPIKLFVPDPIIMPYKGKAIFDAGIFYAPYIPVEIVRVRVDETLLKLRPEFLEYKVVSI
jgi:hypothetical protein